MISTWLLLILAGVQPTGSAAGPGLAGLATAGRWEQVLTVAVRREAQLPLRAEEALVAAYAARLAGDHDAEAHFLGQVVDDPDLGAVARVELAELVIGNDPARSAELVSPLLRRAPSNELRSRALELAAEAVTAGIGPEDRSRLESIVPTLSRGSRRGIELALARTADPVDRHRLDRLLSASTDDLVALVAAEELLSSGELGVVERWRVAQTLYRHGRYDEAAPILEGLDGVRHSQIPSWEVAYLRGRCAFRRGDWPTAVTWYRTAISRTSSGERRAQLEVHLGRTFELAGQMDDAVAAAQRAVRTKTTDDRRLFLARLRLLRGEPDLAQAGLSRIKSRTRQARGELMFGLYEMRIGQDDAARRRLERVSRDPWRGPAAVLAAGLASDAGRHDEALESLIAGAPGFDSFWAGEARKLVAALPEPLVERWRELERAQWDDPAKKTRWRSLSRSLKLETDPARLEGVRSRSMAEAGLNGDREEPVFPPGLAAELWALGLKSSALRWDPSGLPRETPEATWWTAEAELELGRPWLAISAADAARWQASSYLPPRGLPLGLRRALYPLPHEEMVRAAAVRHRVPWSLLAGVAREESRWNPRVVSKVGARGLMQLMPATATATGAANGRPEIEPDDLFEPLISLDLGAAELGRLLEVFDGNRAAVVAAYNAGEAQALLWLNQCGDNCSEARYLAGVSFSVTREYTEAVLGAAAFYEQLY
jgi:soluble lytic murein transglycosylase-like protein